MMKTKSIQSIESNSNQDSSSLNDEISWLSERILDARMTRHFVDEDVRLWSRDRWQMVSDDCVWMFPAELRLSTVEMAPGWLADFGYQYESCLFRHHDSQVLERYITIDEAIAGHRKLAEQYKLKNERKKNEF